jgi:hypothetical protein
MENWDKFDTTRTKLHTINQNNKVQTQTPLDLPPRQRENATTTMGRADMGRSNIDEEAKLQLSSANIKINLVAHMTQGQ